MKTLRQILDEANNIATLRMKASYHANRGNTYGKYYDQHKRDAKEAFHNGSDDLEKYHTVMARKFGRKASQHNKAEEVARHLESGKSKALNHNLKKVSK